LTIHEKGDCMNNNVAIGKTTSSDSSYPGHMPDNVIDGRPDTYWTPADNAPGHWWKIDLGSEIYINEILVTWVRADKVRYKLELSFDDRNWINASDILEYAIEDNNIRHIINSRARYVRITLVDGLPQGQQSGISNVTIFQGQPAEFICGADVSHLLQIEDFGGKFYDRQGREQDCLQILKDHGVNYIRLKLWNKPGLPLSDPAGYNDKAHVMEMARRVKEMGFKLLLDFHYSDWWADPGKQTMPKDWEGLDFPELEKALYDFTYDVVKSLADQGTTPDMVQVGNEISNGMLWDVAKISDEFNTDSQWDKFCILLKSGMRAVKDVKSSIRTVIHIERSGDNAASVYFFDNLTKRNVEFDVIGLSYYSIWHGPVSVFSHNVFDLAKRYDKDILIVETAYPYTEENGDDTPNSTSTPYSRLLPEYPPTIQGQANNLQAVASVVKKIPNGKGLGFFYWEPAFIPVEGAGWKYGEGSEWDDQTLFDFNGHALWSLDVFRMHAPNMPSIKNKPMP